MATAPHPLLETGDGAPSLRPLYMLLPYLWPKGRPDLKFRVIVSLICLAFAILVTTVSPYIFGWITNRLAGKATPGIAGLVGAGAFGLIVGYAASRILMQAFAQLRDGIFAKVQYHALREVGVSTFAHVHTLSLRFHLEKKTGGLSRIIERGTKGIDTLLSFALFSIFPTLFQLLIFSVSMLYAFFHSVSSQALVADSTAFFPSRYFGSGQVAQSQARLLYGEAPLGSSPMASL